MEVSDAISGLATRSPKAKIPWKALERCWQEVTVKGCIPAGLELPEISKISIADLNELLKA